ncbi:MAG TPA: HAMP domain-containing sensor histidine kinase [Thermomicrobiaceae bacterium]|nr:HAMP domain-containing sensor histidine kinase [Thermomicrobiaceae bacterium]
MPSSYTVVAPFALALVLASRRFGVRGTLLASASILVLFAGIAANDGVPVLAGLTELLALGLIGYLGYRDARSRGTASGEHQRLVREHQNLLRFLAAVAHDMRQPLTSIQGYAHVLQRGGGRDLTEYRALEAMADAAQRLERLTADLADASAVGSGHFALKSGPVDLVALLRGLADDYQPTSSRHELVVDGPERLIGIWDGDRLRQLFGNLIGNAIKYAPAGEVRIDLYHTDSEIAVTVSDQGVGIDAEQMRFLFQPFSRLRPSSTNGTGLGLYIAQGIARAHGGFIAVESEPGAGSTFRVALPLVSGSMRPRSPRPQRTRHPVAVPSPRAPFSSGDELPLDPPPAASDAGGAEEGRPDESGLRLPAS